PDRTLFDFCDLKYPVFICKPCDLWNCTGYLQHENLLDIPGWKRSLYYLGLRIYEKEKGAGFQTIQPVIGQPKQPYSTDYRDAGN
ncbi:unnamed protein product, partial [marine sediment metagenome]